MFLGVLSGLISGTICFILVYIVGVVAIAVKAEDLLATALAALTVLPLMLIFVLLIPTAIICILIGFTSATLLSLTSRSVSIIAAAVVGLVLSEILLGLILPIFATESNAELLSIARNPFVIAVYGLLLGSLTGCLFRWISRG